MRLLFTILWLALLSITTVAYKAGKNIGIKTESTLRLEKSPADPAPELQKWLCPSCSYIYDESKGYKKKYPPGTKFTDIPVFLCPGSKSYEMEFIMPIYAISYLPKLPR